MKESSPIGATRKRATVYARFSTDLQNERSIEDQLSLCQSYAEREGLYVVSTYEDRARSGGSVMGREGLLQMLDKARERCFDVVIVEALDRLSRDMEDLAGIHKRLSFLGIEIRAVHEGVVNTVLVGLRGLVGQLYREDNAHKVRRGQAGRVKQGLAGGGLTYGYAAVAERAANESSSRPRHKWSGASSRNTWTVGRLAKSRTILTRRGYHLREVGHGMPQLSMAISRGVPAFCRTSSM